MTTRDSCKRQHREARFQLSEIVHEEQQLRRELAHLLKKRMERKLSEWEELRLSALPDELFEVTCDLTSTGGGEELKALAHLSVSN